MQQLFNVDSQQSEAFKNLKTTLHHDRIQPVQMHRTTPRNPLRHTHTHTHIGTTHKPLETD